MKFATSYSHVGLKYNWNTPFTWQCTCYMWPTNALSIHMKLFYHFPSREKILLDIHERERDSLKFVSTDKSLSLLYCIDRENSLSNISRSIYMLQPNMSTGFGKIRADESVNENGFEISEFDSGDRFAKTDREQKEMKTFVEKYPPPGDKMESKGKLGLEPEWKPKIDSILESTNDVGQPMVSCPPLTSQTPHHSPNIGAADFEFQSDFGMETHRAIDLLMSVSVCTDENKLKINELVVAAMEELTIMALEGEPLWRRVDREIELLNDSEYIRKFRPLDATLNEIIRIIKVGEPLWPPNLDNTVEFSRKGEDTTTSPKECGQAPLQIEASRETGFVFVNPINLVELLMDVDQWSYVFSNIVSRAMVLGFLSTGVEGSLDGALQVMTAEFHIPSPLVQARECYFARYCKQLAHGTWGIVDVSLENIFPNPLTRYRRRPSGCLIQGMPDGYSKVIWVEHVEADTRLTHTIFQPLVVSGFAFCAKRWVATLVRQCERLATVMAISNPAHDGVIIPQAAGRKSLFKLAGRMMRGFCADVNASTENIWMPLPITGFEDVRVMTKNSIDDPGRPPGTAIVVATSFWLPAPMKRVFNFLRDGNSRNKWDVLSPGYVIQEIIHITNGHDPGNHVSILQANATPNQIEVLYLQESYTDSTGSYVIYAPMDIYAATMVLKGGNSDYVAILPSGFAILPYMQIIHGEEIGGSLLTVAFQIMDNKSTMEYIPPESVYTIYKLITETVSSIKAALIPDHP